MYINFDITSHSMSKQGIESVTATIRGGKDGEVIYKLHLTNNMTIEVVVVDGRAKILV